MTLKHAAGFALFFLPTVVFAVFTVSPLTALCLTAACMLCGVALITKG